MAPRGSLALPALALVLLRVLDALSLRTFFNPDEYWQGPEVAHKLVFGVGLLTWEWLPGAQIRSCLHPLLFAGLYRLLQATGLDTRAAVAHGPAVLQGVVAALGTDLYLLRLADRICAGQQQHHAPSCLSPWLALALQLTNWFNWYALPRTFSSSLEAALLAPALFHWLATAEHLDGAAGKRRAGSASLPRHAVSWEERLSLILGAVAVLVRPTAVFFWLPLGFWRLHHTKGGIGGVVAYLLRVVLPIGLLVLLGGTLLDSWCYARLLGESSERWWSLDALVVAPWRFLRFNLLEGKARLYGTHAWHWYFSQGLPAVLASQLPFLLFGLRRLLHPSPSNSPTGLRLAAWALLVYPIGLSLSPHKEFRFLLPILPLASLLGAYGLAPFFFSNPSTGPATRRRTQHQQAQQGPARWAVAVVSALLLAQAPMAWYFGRVHQRGPLGVIAYLAGRLQQQQQDQPHDKDSAVRIDFLLPCHATPWTSHLHVPSIYTRLRLRHLDCGPDARARGDAEMDVFLADPLRFARALYDEQREPVPDYVVAFASAAAAVEGYLGGKGLAREAAFFYSAFKGDVDSAQLEDSLLVFGRLGGGESEEGEAAAEAEHGAKHL